MKSPFEGMRLALFDLDGTLRKLRPSSLQMLDTLGESLGISLQAEQRRAAVRWSHAYWVDRQRIDADIQRFTDEEFLENYLTNFAEALNLSAEQAPLKDAFLGRVADGFERDSFLVPGAKALLWGLREAGLTIGLVSNRRHPLTGLAIELGVMEHFHFTLAAGQINSWKPDARIFEHALQLGGNVPPEQAVYIGDNYYADIVGARNAGLSAILLDEEGAFPEAKNECFVVGDLSGLADYLPGVKT